MAKKETDELADYPRKVFLSLNTIRESRIREARARKPTPTYQQIALEVGCSEKTVYNILHRDVARDA